MAIAIARLAHILGWQFSPALLELVDEHDLDLDRSAQSYLSHSLAGERSVWLLCIRSRYGSNVGDEYPDQFAAFAVIALHIRGATFLFPHIPGRRCCGHGKPQSDLMRNACLAR